MSLRAGIVVAVHADDHSVDLVMADDGSRLSGVQVFTPNGSARSGNVDLPYVPERSGDKWDITKMSGQDMKAIVGFIGRNPVVLGFLYPQINQMLLNDGRIKRYRHPSDVELTIDGDGNTQLAHPSGTYIRIGEVPDFDDVASKAADSSATDRNKDKKVSVRIGMAGGSAKLTISPGGEITVETESDVMVDAKGAVTVKSPVGITLETPLVTIPEGDLVASGISLVKHLHKDVRKGDDLSGEPDGALGS